jgi:phosphohistidine phosphatase SixA
MKLWFAGEAGNWDLAGYEAKELGEGFDDVLTFHPTHEDAPVAPKDAIPRMVTQPVADLKTAIANKDRAAFERSFDALTGACNNCHKAMNFGFNVVQRPSANPYANQVFATPATLALVETLRRGGCVIVMRHASSPMEHPDQAHADPGNGGLERQLDGTGRATAAAMGRVFRDLRIPVGDVLSSPTYRARETVRLAGWPAPVSTPELGDNGRGMQQIVPEAQAEWLRKRVALAPSPGANTILVTHSPNIARAFPASSGGLTDGEALIFKPDGKGGAAVVARVKIDDWPRLVP